MPTNLPAQYIVVGTLYTLDEDKPRAEAMAVDNGTILAVGSVEDARTALPHAPVIRHEAGVVLPGLVDAHNHHAVAGEEDLFRLAFPATASTEEIIAAVAGAVGGVEDGGWIVGGNWGSSLVDELSQTAFLTRIDEITGDVPVLLTDDSHHNKWANTAAMRLAGILDADADAKYPRQIVRDADGNPSGQLLENAGSAVEQVRLVSGRPDAEYYARCSERGIEMLAEYGVVAFQDAAASLENLEGLRKLDDEGRLKAWAVSSMLITDNIFGNEFVGEALIERGPDFASKHHRPTWTKIFLDGVPPSHTSAFLEPYVSEDGHEDFGTTLMPLDELTGWLRIADAHGVGVKIHATGDGSVHEVLDAVETVRAEGATVPVQIAHGQFITAADRPRMVSLGVIEEISPYIWFPGVIADAVGEVLAPEVMAGFQPNRTLLDLGVSVVVGSDWPVSESPNPWQAIEGLVTRQDPTGVFSGTLVPEEAITVEEAIRAVTSHAADAIGVGDVTGRLRAGQSADFIFVDQDPYQVPADQLASTRVVRTHFAGEVVYEA
jgi:predicted amidohydrolase YtcJ